MGKYASWSEFEKNVPITYAERATPESYRTGMNGIAAQKIAKHTVVGIGRKTANHIAGVDVFN